MSWHVERLSLVEAARFNGTTTSVVALRRWYDGEADVPADTQEMAATPERDRMEMADGTKVPLGAWVIRGIAGDFWCMLDEDFVEYFERVDRP